MNPDPETENYPKDVQSVASANEPRVDASAPRRRELETQLEQIEREIRDIQDARDRLIAERKKLTEFQILKRFQLQRQVNQSLDEQMEVVSNPGYVRAHKELGELKSRATERASSKVDNTPVPPNEGLLPEVERNQAPAVLPNPITGAAVA